ncbi:formylglycine-generating enzyme family protein [Candidatus Palauibacter sp.]|uniref:formylglycine-generating enzyme family protein n=1 Tax=Candidatus Palauibacter sp. TaxID=3101350 RepID=UPI003C6FD4F9
MFRYGMRWLVVSGFLSAAAAEVHAQTLYSENGIEVRASARIIEYGAEGCQVLEEHESAASYRRKRGNDGQPIDIWQMDYSVYNGSERPLAELLAVYRVEAHEPPCTLWGLRASRNLPGPVRLKAAFGEILRAAGDDPLPRGETLTATSYVYVFRGHRAWFADWSVNYQFAAVPVVQRAPAPVRVPEGANPTQPPPPPAAVPEFVPPDIPPVDPANVFSDCSGCPQMVKVPAGTFTVGSPASERGRGDDEGPQHSVTIGAPFAVGMYEVTFAEWDACVRAGGCDYEPDDEGWGRGDRPVTNVNWTDARTYVRWLSRHTGQEYRLPSEAEWEYAARAGSQTARYWGESQAGQCRYANGDDGFASCADGHEYTAPVGSFAPNAFGLYDVIGNVAEWTQDCRNDDYSGAPTDARARESDDCTYRVLRGGSWLNESRDRRSARRDWNNAAYRFLSFGFRVARTLNR